MTDPAPSPTAVAEPPAPPAATPPAAVTPPVVPPVTPPAAAPAPAVDFTAAPPPVTPPATPAPATPAVTSYELKAPEGNLMTKDYIAQFQKDAIAAGLSQEAAQDLLDTQVNAVKDYETRTKDSVDQAKKQWAEQSRTDTEIGGDHFNRTAELSKRVVDKFGNDAFKKLLNDSGFGSYPEVLRFLSKVGAAFSEDQLRAGNPSSGGTQKSREEILFGGTTPA